MAGRGKAAVREALAGAQEAPPAGVDGGGDKFALPRKALPDDCPVIAVGTEKGVFYYLSALGELRGLKSDQVANKQIVGLFAPMSDYLMEKWPRKKEVAVTVNGKKLIDAETGEYATEWIVTGWRTDDVSMLLMDAAAAKGVWNAREKVRGRGGWQADDGSLILHAGNKVLIGGLWRDPGLYEGLVYPTQPASPRPAAEAATDAMELAPQLCDYLDHRRGDLPAHVDCGYVLLELFKCWQFARPEIDPYLLLGWNVVSPYGAALDYRPLLWLTGDTETGKSALQKAIGLLHDGGILQSPDATEAAVRQILGQQSLPVAIDEAEADEDNRKLLALVKLARLAATSQGNILKGGQDHEGHEFRATSCFLFSSILIPPIPPQDKNRLAVLEMEPLPAHAREPALDKREFAALGAQLRRTMAERWPLWPRRLAAFRNAMIDVGGHRGRTADQFGTLLAAADLMLNEAEPTEEALKRWGELMAASTLTEVADNESEAERCLGVLVSRPVQLGLRSERRTVGEWLLDATKPLPKLSGFHENAEEAEERGRRDAARRAIERIGLMIVVGKTRKEGEAVGRKAPIPGVTYVAVASVHEGLAELFQGKRWNGGGWAQALRRVPGAVPYERQRIGGRPTACTLVPIEAFVIPERVEDAATAERERVE